jgi:hypothetical protein
VAQAAGPTRIVLFDVSEDKDICMATVWGLTQQVVQAAMPYHSKLLHKAAQEVLAVDILRREDLKILLNASQYIKEEYKKRKREGKIDHASASGRAPDCSTAVYV